MAIELVMPRLGWTMEEGTLVEWLKQDGDQVEVGDMVFAVESDKALNEVEALDAGILRIPPDSPAPGSVLKVGTLLAYLLEPGEEMPTTAAPPMTPEQATATTAPAPAPTAAVSTSAAKKRSGPTSSPRARRLAKYRHHGRMAWGKLSDPNGVPGSTDRRHSRHRAPRGRGDPRHLPHRF